MFEIKTHLELVSYDYTASNFIRNPRERYIDIDNVPKIRDVIEHRKFTPEFIKQLITITFNNKVVVGFNVPSGLDLWKGSYIPALEDYFREGKSIVMYGIEPVILQLETINDEEVSFSIFGEWEPKEVFANAILPEKQFLEALLDGACHFWQMLIEYKVFEEGRLQENTPRDYPQQMI